MHRMWMCSFLTFMSDGVLGNVAAEAQHRDHLERHPYRRFTQEEMDESRTQLKEEMGVVKHGMGHGDLTLDAYSQVR